MGTKVKEIRQSIVNRMKAASSIVAIVPAERIFRSRPNVIDQDELPAIAVVTGNDSASDENTPGKFDSRNLTVNIYIGVASNSDADDNLDDLKQLIEDLFEGSDGKWEEFSFQNCDYGISDEGSKVNATARLDFEIKYRK